MSSSKGPPTLTSDLEQTGAAVVDVYVGVGSNVEPERYLRCAADQLSERFGVLRCSSVFSSPAVGFSGPDFLNMVIAFTTTADADAVERVLTDIEYEGGRQPRQQRFSSRTLDLDLLLYGAMVDARRRVPRDDIVRYPFVLAPLAELACAVPHPLTGRLLGAEWTRIQRGGRSLRSVGSLAALSQR